VGFLESQPRTPLGAVPISSIWGKAAYMGGPASSTMAPAPREEPVRVKPRWPANLPSPKAKPAVSHCPEPSKSRWPACLSPKIKRVTAVPSSGETKKVRWPSCLSPKMSRKTEGTSSSSSWSWKTVCGIQCRKVTTREVDKQEVRQTQVSERRTIHTSQASNYESRDSKYIRYSTGRSGASSGVVRAALPSTYTPPHKSSTYGRYPLHPIYTWRKAASRSFKHFSPKNSLSSRLGVFSRKFHDFRSRFY